MNAIQRWYLYIDAGGSEEFLDYKPGVDKPVQLQDQWCKAKDVETLEHLIENQSKLHAQIRESMQKRIEFMEGMALDADEERRRYQERIGQLEQANAQLEERYERIMSRTRE